MIAAQRPEMRLVQPRSADRQSNAILYRSRQRLVRQRTELVNALGAGPCEYGHAVPPGIRHPKRIREMVEAPNSDLPAPMREECVGMLDRIGEQTDRIAARTAKIEALAAATDRARRLETLPGVGPLTAMAVEAFAPPMESFRKERDFAAWLGFVPRRFSSGGKERPGRITKAGQADIRQRPIIGAMSRLDWIGRKTIPEGSWPAGMPGRKPRMLAAIALANKMARQIRAMLTRNENYRDPAPAMTA